MFFHANKRVAGTLQQLHAKLPPSSEIKIHKKFLEM
jgi:hypothetical protein